MIKRKQIEKAAFKCIGAPCIRDCEKCQKVWHDMGAEVPQIYGDYGDSIYPQIPCLVVGLLSTGYGYGVRYWNVTEQCWDDEECDGYECDKDKIEEWAYLDDLIPERGNKMSYDMDMCEAMTHNGYCPLREQCKRFILGQKALMEDYYPIYWVEPCYEDGKCELFIEVK